MPKKNTCQVKLIYHYANFTIFYIYRPKTNVYTDLNPIYDNLTRSGRFNVLIPDTIVNKINPQHWQEQNIEALTLCAFSNQFKFTNSNRKGIFVLLYHRYF
jgi:hypothetical protein